MSRLLALVFVLASSLPIDAQPPPVQRNVDVHLAAYGLVGFGGKIVAEREDSSGSADLPTSFGGGARAGVTVPHARIALQAEVGPMKPEGVRDRHRATSVSLYIAARHRVHLDDGAAIEPYIGIAAGVALYDVESVVWSGRALHAAAGLMVLFGRVGGFVELGWQRFDLGSVPDDGLVPMSTSTNADIHFDRAQARIGLAVEL